MVRYLLVDDRDGRVLAEFASPLQAARVIARQVRGWRGDPPPVSVVRIGHQQGGLSEVASMVSVRPLPPPMRGSTASASSLGRLSRQPSPALRVR